MKEQILRSQALALKNQHRGAPPAGRPDCIGDLAVHGSLAGPVVHVPAALGGAATALATGLTDDTSLQRVMPDGSIQTRPLATPGPALHLTPQRATPGGAGHAPGPCAGGGGHAPLARPEDVLAEAKRLEKEVSFTLPPPPPGLEVKEV